MTPRVRVLLGLAGLLWAGTASAQAPGLLGWGGTGEIGTRWDLSEGHTNARPTVIENGVHGWFASSVRGALFEPRWLAWSWTVRPGFVRAGGNQPFASLHTEEFAHQFSATSRPASWLSAEASSERDRVVAQRGADASRESRFARAEARVDVRTPWLGVGADGHRERADEHWVSALSVPELDRRIRRRTASVWLESSHLRIEHRLAHEDFPELGSDVETRQTTLDHAVRWGHGSSLRSRLEWAGQSPLAATIVDRSVEENLRIRHASGLLGEYSVRRTHSHLTVGEGRDQSNAVEFSSRIDGLALGLGASERSDRSPGRDGRAWSAGPHASWNRAWHGGARLGAEAGVRLERESRRGLADARIAVLDESHAVGSTRSFSLAIEGADSSTVLVRDAAGHSGFVEGTDYVLVRSGATLLVVIPLASRIAEGDLLLIRYEATPPGTPERRATRIDLGLGAEWHGVSLRLDDRQRVVRDSPLERGASSLGSREQSGSVNASWPWRRARVELSSALRRREVESRLARTADQRAGLTWIVSPGLVGTADAVRSSASDPAGTLVSRILRARLDGDRAAAIGWSIRFERAVYSRTRTSDITQTAAGLDLDARWAKLEGTLRFDAGTRSADGDRHRFQRVTVTALRRL